MNTIRIFILVPVVLFFQWSPVFSQIKKPVSPHTPSVGLKEKKSIASYPVLLDFPQDKKIRGRIIFNIERIRVPVASGSRYIKISDIKSIDFIKWRGKEYSKNSYLFKPSMTKIILNDGSSLIINGNFSRFNKIRFLPREKSPIKSVYSVFYDYYKKSKWINSGRSEMDYPEENPHRGTLVRIEFLRVAESGLFTEEILKYIKNNHRKKP
jgi:hypothetical protein